jgi:restriction system protein
MQEPPTGGGWCEVIMSNYYRVMLGKGSVNAEECFAGNFIGVDFGVDQDLTGKLTENWREFNREFIPVFLATHPDKSRVGAGLACGFLWTVAFGIRENDIVLCPNGTGGYRVGEVVGGYSYRQGEVLPHRRPVRWRPEIIQRADMSPALKNAAGAIGTVSNVTRYKDEVEGLIQGQAPPSLIATDETVEDPSVFALEQHLEDFLVQNWAQTELGKNYDIYEDESGSGKQYPTDTGQIDILAISKDRNELLVVELKRGRASDVVVGQVQRYMGYVAGELAEEGQQVRGVIIALEDDLKIRRALAVAPNIAFYKYQVSFKLLKA